MPSLDWSIRSMRKVLTSFWAAVMLDADGKWIVWKASCRLTQLVFGLRRRRTTKTEPSPIIAAEAGRRSTDGASGVCAARTV